MANQTTSSWFDRLSHLLLSGRHEQLTECLTSDAWFRDVMITGSAITSRQGHDAITSYLSDHPLPHFLAVELCTDHFNAPTPIHFGPAIHVTSVQFTFELEKSLGRGVAMVQDGHDGEGPRAISLALILDEWKGYEERYSQPEVTADDADGWVGVEKRRRRETEEDLEILILGAGQAGLQTAARMQQMGFRALVIEKTARIGDIWRLRYPTLALHLPKHFMQFLYQDYPKTFPMYPPAAKLADFMEQYAASQDLCVWCSTILEGRPTYDRSTKRWRVVVTRAGSTVVLKPKYFIWATGQAAEPIIPHLPGQDTSPIMIRHSSAFHGGEAYRNHRVLVVGTGNSGMDIGYECHLRGARVTFLQRTGTVAVSQRFTSFALNSAFPPDIPITTSDSRAACAPIKMLIDMADKDLRGVQAHVDGEMMAGLRSKGFICEPGMHHGRLYGRFGGFFVDTGFTKPIIDGHIEVISNADIASLEGASVKMSNGDTLDVDSIILCTGYGRLAGTLRKVFGPLADRLKEIWGIDEHGELRTGFTPSGMPGLYVACGEFAAGRTYSKYLVSVLR